MRRSFAAGSALYLLSGISTLHCQTGYDSRAVSSFLTHRASIATLAHRLNTAKPGFAQLPGNADCVAAYGTPCYSPQDIQRAYGIAPLLDAGYAGRDETIVIIVSYGSPTLQRDVKKFDAQFGLPDPPSLKVLAPLGAVPFDPNDGDQLGWAGETSLDVEWAHALAPEARIVVLTSPVDETQGVQGLPEFLELEKYALDHHLGQIISQSWGTAENTLFTPEGEKVLSEFDRFYRRAAEEHVTVLTAAGDYGTENVEVNGNEYPFPTVNFPASSPFVTAVGGTTLTLNGSGDYESETVWNDSAMGYGASGGGVSQYFREPHYQRDLRFSVQAELGGRRGVPDLAFNADPDTPVWVYFSFFPDPADAGFYPAGSGTSAAAPSWAGIIADANQLAGRPLGFLNPKLYAIGARDEEGEFLHDIKAGNNAYNGLTGYEAKRGWDAASGWGTPKFGKLIWELCRQD